MITQTATAARVALSPVSPRVSLVVSVPLARKRIIVGVADFLHFLMDVDVDIDSESHFKAASTRACHVAILEAATCSSVPASPPA